MGRLGLGEGSHSIIIPKEQRDPGVTEFGGRNACWGLSSHWALFLEVR